MVLESTVICIDNSEYMRNGDFIPNRLIAQQEAVLTIFYAKTNDNPESTVALISQSNPPEVLCTLTTDASRFVSKLLLVQTKGDINMLCSLRIAQLVLKHRKSRNHKMRIIVFVGSAIIGVHQTEFTALAKKLKKEKVSVDVVNFGEEKNMESLNAFIKELEGTSSHMVSVKAGTVLQDAIKNSPVIMGEDGSGRAAATNLLGVDPNQDPELAMALRISMEEQRRQLDESSSNAGVNGNRSGISDTHTDADDETLLAEAIAMSLKQMESSISDEDSNASFNSSSSEHNTVDAPDFASMTDEERINYVLRLSLQDAYKDSKSSDAQHTDQTTVHRKDKDNENKEKAEVIITKLDEDNGHKTPPMTLILRNPSKEGVVSVDNEQKENKTTVPMETDNTDVSDNKKKIVKQNDENTETKMNRKQSPKTRLQKKKLKEQEENSGKKEKQNESNVMETDNSDANKDNENGVEETVANKKTKKTLPNDQNNKSEENAKKKSNKRNKKQKRQ